MYLALWSLCRWEEALSDCIWAQKHMRGNAVIDYRQLGLRYKLYSWQVCNSASHTHTQTHLRDNKAPHFQSLRGRRTVSHILHCLDKALWKYPHTKQQCVPPSSNCPDKIPFFSHFRVIIRIIAIRRQNVHFFIRCPSFGPEGNGGGLLQGAVMNSSTALNTERVCASSIFSPVCIVLYVMLNSSSDTQPFISECLEVVPIIPVDER